MSNIIKPTVGRKVWYRASKFDMQGPGGMQVQHVEGIPQPLDATVLAVWGDRCINVQILDIMGRPFAKTSITLIQEGDATPKNMEGGEAYGYVEWMPYQTMAAAREPALNAAVLAHIPIGSSGLPG